MSPIKLVGTLDAACAEAQWWLTIVGTLDVPLRSPVPLLACLPEIEEAQQVYMIDLDRLTDRQIDSICHIMAAKFDVPLQEVCDGIRKDHGLPIRADRLTTLTFEDHSSF